VNEDEVRPAEAPGVELRDEQRERPSREGSSNLDEAFRSGHVGEVLARLDRELVGLIPVKTRIREIAHALLADALRGKAGLVTERPALHMAFTGYPGTGKTTVALRMAEIFYRLGYIRKGHLVSATRDDLVALYAGYTAPKTKEVLKRAAGGVLFIDEAYDLYKPDDAQNFGGEALGVLGAVLQNSQEDIAVIFAGYKDRMDAFLHSNPAFASRVAYHVDFPSYSTDELIAIAYTMLERLNYEFTPAADQAFREYIALRLQQPQFANARSVRNAIDRARLRQATRLLEAGGNIGPRTLRIIDEADVRSSRAFQR
jgi:probable Rubsico expression protein CbbX